MIININNVSKSYSGSSKQVLTDINFNIKEGEIFGVVGNSGAGKSTLLRLMNALELPTTGDVTVKVKEQTFVINNLQAQKLRALRKHIGMIFQNGSLLSSATVFDNVAFPLTLDKSYDRSFIKQQVNKILALVGLSGFDALYPSKLSGGQQQRVGIARALAISPTILLCDEITSSLDPITTQQILALLREINEILNITIVLITHEMEVIKEICDRVAVIENGSIVEIGNTLDIVLNPSSSLAQSFMHTDVSSLINNINGKIIRLIFIGGNTYASVLETVTQKVQFDYSVIEGNIGRIKDTMHGNMVLSLQGGDIEGAILAFKEHGAFVNILRS